MSWSLSKNRYTDRSSKIVKSPTSPQRKFAYIVLWLKQTNYSLSLQMRRWAGLPVAPSKIRNFLNSVSRLFQTQAWVCGICVGWFHITPRNMVGKGNWHEHIVPWIRDCLRPCGLIVSLENTLKEIWWAKFGSCLNTRHTLVLQPINLPARFKERGLIRSLTKSVFTQPNHFNREKIWHFLGPLATA